MILGDKPLIFEVVLSYIGKEAVGSRGCGKADTMNVRVRTPTVAQERRGWLRAGRRG
jgi:hypothetical protein